MVEQQDAGELKARGDAVTDQAHLAINKLQRFSNEVPPHNDNCPWCDGKDHWAGRLELCPAPASRAIIGALNARPATPAIDEGLAAARLRRYFETHAWTDYDHPSSPFKDLDALTLPTPTAPTAREVEAREAFLDMCADAVDFHEEPDGDETGNHTRILLNTHWRQFERLAEAFGIKAGYMETPFGAVERAISERVALQSKGQS